jgi:dihydrofolate reductase
MERNFKYDGSSPAGYWPTDMAMQKAPVVAQGMNKAEKIVFSRTLKKPEWNNTRLVRDNMIEEVKKLKKISHKDLTVLGSGSIVTQLAEHGLIDTYEFMVDPVALGNGTPLFQGLQKKLDLKLIKTKTFKSGVVLLVYSNLE